MTSSIAECWLSEFGDDDARGAAGHATPAATAAHEAATALAD